MSSHWTEMIAMMHDTFSELIPSSSLASTYHTLFPLISTLLPQCNQRLYLLSQLKSQNLSAQCLDIIFQALILSYSLKWHAIPAFAELSSVTLKSNINKFFHKAHRRGLVTTVFDIQGLIDKHDTHLFRLIAYTDHCLHYLLPEKLNSSMNLRHRGHEYTLSHIRTTQLKNTFVNRSNPCNPIQSLL